MKLYGGLHRWRLWLGDGWDEWLWDDDAGEYHWRTEPVVEWLDQHVMDRLQKLTCRIFGHEPIPDQCNKPEHEHCAWCRRPLPYSFTRSREVE